MANSENLIPIIQKWEGGYSNHPTDKGGCTMKGITIRTFRHYFGSSQTCSDLRSISDEQWKYIFEDGYWNPCKGDDIEDQSVANIIVDWAWMSGVKTAVKKVQKILKVDIDGVVGQQTLYAINSSNPEKLFYSIYDERKNYYLNICDTDPDQEVFLRGWLNRLNDFDYN